MRVFQARSVATPEWTNNINPPPTQIWARTDYFPIPGLHNTCLQAAGLPQTYINAVGDNTDSGTITNPQITGTIRMASITDGTSNTMIVSECAGRPAGYNGFRQIYFYAPDNLLVDGVIEPVTAGGGAWADQFTYARLAAQGPSKRLCEAALAWLTAPATMRSIPFTPAGQWCPRRRLRPFPQRRRDGSVNRHPGHQGRRRDP